MYFLKLLKRSRVSIVDLQYFYISIVRPVLEYACQVWHSSLTKEQSTSIEKIQKRALRIIHGCDNYDHLCMVNNIAKLDSRRDELNKNFFKTILHDSNCLHYLLPAPRPTDILNSLRTAKKYETIRARTDRYKKSFLVNALNFYQVNWHFSLFYFIIFYFYIYCIIVFSCFYCCSWFIQLSSCYTH